MRRTQFLTVADARPFRRQHQHPCTDCPWKRAAIKGWLGPHDVETWLKLGHSHCRIECHTRAIATGVMTELPIATIERPHWQCAGASIYRANVIQRVDPPGLILPKNPVVVFATPIEFRAHHLAGPLGRGML